jgi:hypothetical protein
MKIRMTDPRGHRADQDLAWAGLADLDILDLERLSHLTQDGGLHLGLSLSLQSLT